MPLGGGGRGGGQSSPFGVTTVLEPIQWQIVSEIKNYRRNQVQFDEPCRQRRWCGRIGRALMRTTTWRALRRSVILPSARRPLCPMTTNVGKAQRPKPLLSTRMEPVRSKAFRQEAGLESFGMFSPAGHSGRRGHVAFGFALVSLATRVLSGLGRGRFGYLCSDRPGS